MQELPTMRSRSPRDRDNYRREVSERRDYSKQDVGSDVRFTMPYEKEKSHAFQLPLVKEVKPILFIYLRICLARFGSFSQITNV